MLILGCTIYFLLTVQYCNQFSFFIVSCISVCAHRHCVKTTHTQWQSHRSCLSCPAWLKKIINIIFFLLPKIQFFHCQNTIIPRPYLVLKYKHWSIRSLCPFLLNTGFPALSLFVFSPYFFSLLSLLWRCHAQWFRHELVAIRIINWSDLIG